MTRSTQEQNTFLHRERRKDRIGGEPIARPSTRQAWRVTIFFDRCKPYQADIYRGDLSEMFGTRWMLMQVGSGAYLKAILRPDDGQDVATVTVWVVRTVRPMLPTISERMVTVEAL